MCIHEPRPGSGDLELLPRPVRVGTSLRHSSGLGAARQGHTARDAGLNGLKVDSGMLQNVSHQLLGSLRD